MSELINNREYRQKVLKEIITQLHQGKTVEEVKPIFEKLIRGVSAGEIVEMEQALIKEGMPVEQIQNLCDVHAAVFKGSIDEIHRTQDDDDIKGEHPLEVFERENSAVEDLIDKKINPIVEKYKVSGDRQVLKVLSAELIKLKEIDKHYLRKENLLFPYLEKYGVTAPPKVMWGVDDEIREGLNDLIDTVNECEHDRVTISKKATEVVEKIKDMIFKEEKILFPMAQDSLSESDWAEISKESAEIGFTLIETPKEWKLHVTSEAGTKKEVSPSGEISFDAGSMTPAEINALLNTLPLDITFVDKNNKVKYFTQGKERIFARPKTVLGREVKNCHPPASVHVVEKIVEQLKSGEKDHEDFWIKMDDKLVYIRYFAVRDNNGEFLGVAEFTQDISPIKEITGEKRLVE